MKLPFLFKATETTTTTTSAAAASPWLWPSCVHSPKTLSFRANSPNNDSFYKTINSAYLDDQNSTQESFPDDKDSIFSVCTSCRHHYDEEICFVSEEEPRNDEESAVIRGLRSDRLFFEPDETSSILEEAKTQTGDVRNSESVAVLAIESRDPFADFRASMEEMVAAHGLAEWESLEELLACFLTVNARPNHGYIVGAFVDLLIHLDFASVNSSYTNSSSPISAINDEHASSSSTSTTIPYSFTSPLSFSSSVTYSSTSDRLISTKIEDTAILKDGRRSSSSSYSA